MGRDVDGEELELLRDDGVEERSDVRVEVTAVVDADGGPRDPGSRPFGDLTRRDGVARDDLDEDRARDLRGPASGRVETDAQRDAGRDRARVDVLPSSDSRNSVIMPG